MNDRGGITAKQWAILIILALAVVAVLFFMRQVIRNAQEDLAMVSLLPTPTPGDTPMPTSPPPLEPSPTPGFSLSMAGTLAREVAQARELLSRWETPLTPVDAYDLSVVLYRRYQTAPPFPLSEQTLLEIVGLWSPDFEIVPDPVMQAQVAPALYFPDEEQLYVRRDWSGDLSAIRTIVAYSYARALSDQYGNFPRLQAESSSLDRRLALEALAQGDALLSLWLYEGVTPGSPQAEALTEAVATTILPRWRTSAPLLDRLAQLPLTLGSTFAEIQYREGGAILMDEAVRRPARATRQLLEPEIYATWATPVVFDPLTVSLGRDWVVGYDETVGAALMTFILDEWDSTGDITPTIVGWNHDLLQTWEGPEGERVALWQTAWDSSTEASAIFDTFVQLAPSRLSGKVTLTLRPEGVHWGRWWSNAEGAVYLYRVTNRVWFLWGNDIASVAAVARALQ